MKNVTSQTYRHGMPPILCRVVAVGDEEHIRGLLRSEAWPEAFLEVEPLELEDSRRSWQFSTTDDPILHVRQLSSACPRLTFVLDYDTGTVKGMAIGSSGRVEACAVDYLGGEP